MCTDICLYTHTVLLLPSQAIQTSVCDKEPQCLHFWSANQHCLGGRQLHYRLREDPGTDKHHASAPCMFIGVHTCRASRVHMHTPKVLVLTISTHEAVLPSNKEASFRPMPALLTRMSTPASRHLFTMMRGRAITSASCTTQWLSAAALASFADVQVLVSAMS